MSMLKLQGALLRGTETLWVGLRNYSLTGMKEEAKKKLLWEHVELLEVLETRVKQLQADNVSEVLAEEARASWLREEDILPATCSPNKRKESAVSQPSRWIEKLHREEQTNSKRLQKLKLKLPPPTAAAVSGPKEKRTPKPRGKSPESKRRTGCKKAQIHQTNNVEMVNPVKMVDPVEMIDPGEMISPVEIIAPVEMICPVEMFDQEALISEPLTPLVSEDEGKGSSHVQMNILAYLDTCVFLRQPERAHRCLAFYHRSPSRQKLLDVRMYNLVMHGFAKTGSLSPLGRIFQMLAEVRMKPSPDSYVAALSCMGRTKTQPEIIARCLEQLKKDGFSPEELFSADLYQGDEEKMMLEAIRAVVPDFQPPQFAYKAEICTVPLLQDFYAPENHISYPKLDFTTEDLRARFWKQLAVEASGTVTVQSVEKKPVSKQSVRAQELLALLRSRWRASLLQNFQKSKLGLESKRSGQLSLFPFLCVMKDDEYVDILMQTLSTLPLPGESLLVLARDLGNKIYTRYLTQKKFHSLLMAQIQSIYERYVQLLAKDTKPDNLLPREYWEKLAAEAGRDPSLVSREYLWPLSLQVQLGIHLIELMVQVLKVESNLLTPAAEPKLIPVLYHVYSFRGSWQIGFIRLHPILIRLFSEAADTSITFDSVVMPMLCPPVPWVSSQFGAYLFTPAKLMRVVEGCTQQQRALDRCPRSSLFSIFDALNQLGNCPWKINAPILDIIVSIFNDKGNEKLDVPPPPSEVPQAPRYSAEGLFTRAEFKREIARCRKKAAEMYSLRMDALYKLSIAKHMKDQVFWFPHNMDFRGRTYPCPPHFNHLGSDLTRAILLFAEGKPLGPRGLDWLKIHLINLTGLKKKSSLRERLAYANEILEDILDSADRPLTGRKWWMGTDEPWQALACSMEIANAMRSPDPAAYISHFPVHQDGSCNGLQHYAALGRDAAGAASVNLMPCNVPQDVYSVVAQKVEAFRKRDAEEGSQIAQALEGFISRKVVKQTVMTVVYGVTRYGGRLQVEKRLKEIEDFPKKYVWEASQYIVQQVFNSLREMFSGTREIQAWLTESARFIAKSGRVVEWVTPLGLPIIQPYHRSKTVLVKSCIQSINLKWSHDTTEKPNTMKQKNAFPPNFIHSLDSTHMMLTALHCHRQGLTFVSVHDCYWTHAVTVDIMNQVCREQFVKLHQQPILEELSQFMLGKYCTKQSFTNHGSAEFTQKLVELLSSIPPKGDFDLEKVKESTYFFS